MCGQVPLRLQPPQARVVLPCNDDLCLTLSGRPRIVGMWGRPPPASHGVCENGEGCDRGFHSFSNPPFSAKGGSLHIRHLLSKVQRLNRPKWRLLTLHGEVAHLAGDTVPARPRRRDFMASASGSSMCHPSRVPGTLANLKLLFSSSVQRS